MTSHHWLQPPPYLEEQPSFFLIHHQLHPFQPHLSILIHYTHTYTAILSQPHSLNSPTQSLNYSHTHSPTNCVIPLISSQIKTTGPRKFQNPLRTSFYYAPAPHLTQPPTSLVINHIGDIHNHHPLLQFTITRSTARLQKHNQTCPAPRPPRKSPSTTAQTTPATASSSFPPNWKAFSNQKTLPCMSSHPLFIPFFNFSLSSTHVHTHQSLSSLTLESSETSALLKTPDRTYSLRQKNTSNSVILLSPTPDQGIAAISTIRETVELELAPQAAAAGSASSGGPLKNTGSRGKWHEMFGKGR